jgi:hypothetical protein
LTGHGCPHGPKVFERVRNFAAAAIEQGCVGVLVTKGRQPRKWHRAQLDVDGKRLRIEANPRVGPGGAQSGLQAARDILIRVNCEHPLRAYARLEVDTLILATYPI